MQFPGLQAKTGLWLAAACLMWWIHPPPIQQGWAGCPLAEEILGDWKTTTSKWTTIWWGWTFQCQATRTPKDYEQKCPAWVAHHRNLWHQNPPNHFACLKDASHLGVPHLVLDPPIFMPIQGEIFVKILIAKVRKRWFTVTLEASAPKSPTIDVPFLTN